MGSKNCDVEASPLPAVRWVNANDSEIVPVPGKFEVIIEIRKKSRYIILIFI
jgi:hypothetical protein